MAEAPDPPPQATPDPAAAPAAPLRAGLGLLVPLLSIVSLLLLLLIGSAAGMRWLLATEAGTAWLLQRLPLVQMQGFRGALGGPIWHADSLRLPWAGGSKWVLIEGLQAEGVAWQWRPSDEAWVGLRAQSITARKITVHTGAASPGPPTLPADLAPPVHLALAALKVEELVVDEQPPLLALAIAGLEFDPRRGAKHHADSFAFEGFGLTVAGDAQLANAHPYALAGHVTLRPTQDGDAPRWAAVVQASGSLPAIELAATLRGRAQDGAEAPSLDLRAGLQPLQAWMLAHLELQTQALDLAALSPKAPSTRLSGQAELKGGAQSTPLLARVRLDNALPGRWNERRLPVRSLVLELSGSLRQPDRLELTHFDVALADALNPAGHWTGTAVWQGPMLVLDTRLQGVTPQRLDGRAAAMTLTGPVAATLRGLPSPDLKPTAAPPPPGIAWKVALQGLLAGAPQPVQLTLEGSADDQMLDLTQARVQAGSASADLQAKVSRVARGDWRLVTTGRLLNFDPLPWWPGEAGTAWRKGPHRLSGQWQFEVRLPPDAERLSPLALAQRVAGNGTLRVHDSLLAGVPLSADITLGYTQAAAPEPASLHAEFRAGGNELRVEGRGDPAGSGAGDSWRVDISADALSGLAPLAQLHPALADWVPRGGSANAVLAAEGRWPAVVTEGTARVSQLLVGTLSLASGTASWRASSHPEQPFMAQLSLAGLVLGKQRADNLRVDLRGTLADHRIDIYGAMPIKPPPVAEQLLAIEVQSGTRAQMKAQGQWRADAEGGFRWKAAIERLVVGSWDGSVGTAPPASGWAEAHDLRAELQFDSQFRLLTLQADPGRVQLAETAALRWDAVSLDLRGEQPLLQLHADIEPFALAPLLARLQPGTGWQGDLRLAARVDIHAAEKMDAELVFERRDGDLHVSGSEGTQLLGLTEFSLAVSAHEGVWNFSPVFRGRSLGDISGQVTVQSTPARRWPEPAAPIAGQVQARVADVGIWGAWVPPGWHLSGTLATTATIGGTFGDPRFTGELAGSGLGVRNLLQGVNVSDGQVLVRLSGDTAQIERFSLRGGDGSIQITGSATLGNAPQARLQLKAERFRALGRVDRIVIASGDATLQLDTEKMALDGKVLIDEARWDTSRGNAPTLDDDVTVRRAGAPDDLPADKANGKPGFNVALGLDLDLGDNLRVRGSGLDTRLAGQLRITSPGNRLAIHGTIRTEGGTYAAWGQKLDIERGLVAFSGPPDNPRLDVLALRPNIDMRVGAVITGNLLTYRVRLYSEPDMSDGDKFSWLVLGRAPDGLGRSDTAMLQRAALALFAGDGEAPTDALVKALGLDDVSLRQSDTDVRETMVSVGKQLSRRWYVGYERGVNATTGTWQLIYRIAQRFTLRAQSGLENAIDVIWTWRMQETPADAGTRKTTVTPTR